MYIQMPWCDIFWPEHIWGGVNDGLVYLISDGIISLNELSHVYPE